MLRGEEGRQRKELEKLLRWLDDEIRPEVVHLSTVLLCGVARQLRRRLGVPVVATLAGEDVFLEKLPQPHHDAARRELRYAPPNWTPSWPPAPLTPISWPSIWPCRASTSTSSGRD